MLLLLAVLCVGAAATWFRFSHAEKRGESPRPSSETIVTASRYIGYADLSFFQVGTSVQEVLEALDGRGNFEFRYREPAGNEILCLSFAVCWAPYSFENTAYVVWAIFRDDRLEKLVDWVRSEIDEVPFHGTTRSRIKRLAIDANLERAVRAANALAVDIDAIRVKVEGGPRKLEPDWLVTILIAVLPLTRGLDERIAREREENAGLRARFNGGSARLGVTRQEIERIYGPPHKSWEDRTYMVCAYGANPGHLLMPGEAVAPVVVAYGDSLAEIVYGNEFVPAILGEE